MGITQEHFAEHSALELPLRELVRRERQRTPGSTLGVGTGWSSEKSLFDHLETALLAKFIRQQLPAPPAGHGWELSGWANVMHSGDSIAPHDHRYSHRGGENMFAGVYYLTPGPPLLIGGSEIEPEPGLLVIFDALDVHEVPPMEFHVERLSIAFNVRAVSEKD